MFTSKSVKNLTASDFKTGTFELKNNKICGIVLFYSPNCPHCVIMHPTYTSIAEKALFANVCAIDCLQNKDFIVNSMKNKPNFLVGYPTIYLYSSGKPVKAYEGSRDFNSILNELKNLKCSI